MSNKHDPLIISYAPIWLRPGYLALPLRDETSDVLRVYTPEEVKAAV